MASKYSGKSAKSYEKCFGDGKTPVFSKGKSMVAQGYAKAKGATRSAIGKRK